MSLLAAVRRLFRPAAPGVEGTSLPDLGSEYVFRPFVYASDCAVVCRFQRETYETNFPGFVVDQAFLVGFRSDLRKAADDSSHALFVIERHREAIAFLWLVLHENGWTGERSGYINNVFVAPAYRGRGLARQLMRKAADYFRSLGVRRLRLEVSEGNIAAVSLYQSMGYCVTRFVMEQDIADAEPVASPDSNFNRQEPPRRSIP